MSDMDYACRIRNARCIVDERPPMFKAATFLRPTHMKIDNENFKRIFGENTNLLERINKIQRIEGTVVCYNTYTGTRKTRIPNVKKWLKKIDEENEWLGKKLICMKPTFNTREPIKVYPGYRPRKKSHVQEQHRRETYRKLRALLPLGDPRHIPVLLWPKIYLDLGVLNVRPLDRVVIVLYTQAAPNVVLSLVKMCKSDQMRSLSFRRIYPNLWIEGSLEVPPDTEVGETNRSLIDHGQAGTLALLERKGCPGVIQFSISFKPLKMLNGQRVAFGRVVEGLKILALLQDYGTKNGKTKKKIVVLGCGLIR